MKMADAKQKRNEQLKRWIGSETDLEPPVVKRKKTKVKFDDGAVFLAACSSGDTEEVLRLLEHGADINYANVDGLTALHQACIDDNVDMVKFLVENGASINQPDNEGWIPLHAAASCGYLDIAEYLISQGAHVGAVNSEGDTPLDIAEEEAMEELLQNEVNRQGVDIEAARKEEERIMLRDARQWLNSGHINDVRHAKSGGTALHVAAAKGYTEVLKLLIQAGYDVNIKDYDGWTPLHAAAHWGKEEACRILVENLCDMEAVNKVGQTAFDVADEDILGYLEELQKKQNMLHSEKKEKKSPLIESTANMDNNQTQKPFKNKETLIIEQDKNASNIESLEQEKVDEEEEGKKDESSCSSEEDEEEDSESEAETDKNKPATNNSNAISVQTAPIAVTTPSVTTGQVTPTSPIKKYDFLAPVMPVADSVDPASWRQGLRKTGIVLVPSKGEKSLFPTSSKVSPKEDERKDESPASWRLGLRKTGSYGALAEITASKETQKEKDSTGVMRSASSPRLSSSLDNKDKEKDTKGTRLAYVAPTIPRRLASTSDIEEKENRDTSSSLIRGTGSYTRRKWEEDAKKNISNEGSVPLNTSYQRSGSFGRRQDDLISSSIPSITSVSTVTSPAGLQKSLLSGTSTATKVATGSATAGVQSSTSNRLWAEDSTERDKDNVPTAVTVPVAPSVINTATTTTALTTTTSGTVSSTSEVRERRRSYLTPVRDEESESQRKARSRQARQSRRSTQGVTLTDLQEAEKTIGRSRATRPREQENEEKEKEEKEKQDKEKQEEKKELEAKDDDYRQRYTRTVEEPYHRYRTTSSTTSSTSSIATSSSSLSSSQLNRPNSLIGITSAYSRSGAKESEREAGKKEEEKEEDKSQTKSIRERRRPREKRRSTGVSFWTQDSDENDQEHQSDSEEGTNKKEAQGESLSRYDSGSTGDRYDLVLGRTGYSYLEDRKSYSSKLDKEDTTDFKKLYEQILAENEKLKAQLHDTNMELTDLKLQLEKATQRQERFADRSLLEMEKRERRALERRISEMEEELKMLPDLKADNQRLKDENGALIRVISKLSK
ncbi:PREDICTED: protein phosphatase 1 regulatory subunit 12A isoform X3 [Gekko japonicus]|uniref:Protein phosphatase 1 regulatory subunit n=1 Tax=Gekko japonicus TaxID=146911 RepID=A0ABM1KAG2_GEKJA|nr:PREDICTED: protein phosphatase 1 regulatory subunit 12A isoform X3 [Gekko japonicus]